MTFDLTPFLTGTAVAGLAIGATGWFARAIIQQWLSGQLEAHRSNLERQNQVELERLRTQLQVAAAAQQSKFVHLHERQTEVVSEVFARLERMHLAFRRWVAHLRPSSTSIVQQSEDAMKAFNSFVDYYYEQAIWLDKDTTESINRIIQELWAVSIDMTFDVDDNGFPRDRNALKTADKRVRERIPEARSKLDARLRKLLGVDPEELVLPPLPSQD